MRNLHESYDRLTNDERKFVDEVFRFAFSAAQGVGIGLLGDDKAEIAVDALSLLVIQSRGNKAIDIKPVDVRRILHEP